jgi:DNA-binding transcriptional ArsR family regulator
MALDSLYAPLYIYIMTHLSTFQILADPTRFQILETLRGGEHSVNDIVQNVDIDQSGVSRHLRILQETGFVHVRPEGQRRFYSLCPQPFIDLDVWVSQYRRLWEGRLDKFGEVLGRKREAKDEASIDDVWALWTTKVGIESWWGPEGFAVKVHKLDLRPGGEMLYAMTAVDPPQVQFMRQAGMPLTTEAKLTYTEIVL